MECDSESGAFLGTTKVDREIVDVILSGKVNTVSFLPSPGQCLLSSLFQTEAHLQAAWGNYEFTGRVRISDGLVVLVRQSVRHHRAINSRHADF